MKPLTRNWPEVSGRIAAAEQILLAFDYDGTLTPIVSRPEKALLDPETRKILEQLSRRPEYRVAIVSGRKLDQVRQLVGLADLVYAGNHGLELAGGPWQFLHPAGEKARPTLAAAAEKLRRELAEIAGARVEDKDLTISVHLRQVNHPDRRRALKGIIAAIGAERRRGEIRVTSGKEVVEIRPPTDWGKGDILSWLAERIGPGRSGRPVLTVYAGDDRTDEDAFRALATSGVTIKVGGADQPSAARYYLEDSAAVQDFLARLLLIERRRGESMPDGGDNREQPGDAGGRGNG